MRFLFPRKHFDLGNNIAHSCKRGNIEDSDDKTLLSFGNGSLRSVQVVSCPNRCIAVSLSRILAISEQAMRKTSPRDAFHSHRGGRKRSSEETDEVNGGEKSDGRQRDTAFSAVILEVYEVCRNRISLHSLEGLWQCARGPTRRRRHRPRERKLAGNRMHGRYQRAFKGRRVYDECCFGGVVRVERKLYLHCFICDIAFYGSRLKSILPPNCSALHQRS